MSYNYSIIIPYRDTYNMLLKAVGSIPDRDDVQIIIIDNSDKPLGFDDVPQKMNARVDFLTSSPIKGAGCARNVGLKYSIGRYLLFLDADDYYTQSAFEAFDKYLDRSEDIVYFRSDSVNLKDGTQSTRHLAINGLIDLFNRTGDDNLLRYRFVNPIAKMIRSDLVNRNGIQFEEVQVGNDAWFSVMTGHEAKQITADNNVVYMITAGEEGSSLTRIKTKEVFITRFQGMVRINKFLKSEGKNKYRIHLIGALRIAWRDYGFVTFCEALRYAHDCKVSVF